MAQFELIGDKQKLSGGPKNAEPHKGNDGKFEFVGDMVKMSATPVPLQEGKAPNPGKFENVGEKVTMSSTPHKGWASASTPLSDRAKFQSVMPGVGMKKK